MIIKDRVYGETEILEPVLLEIINSPTLQRLKDIDQAGYRARHGKDTPDCSVARTLLPRQDGDGLSIWPSKALS